MAVTIFVVFTLFSKLVVFCSVLAEKCKCIDDKEVGIVCRDRYLFAGSCRSKLLLKLLGIYCREGEEKMFLGKAQDFFLMCFESMTDIVFWLELVSNR